MGVGLYPHQTEALARMHNGCILVGAVGSGKSRTGIAYFFEQCGGTVEPFSPPTNPHDLYIITTARKRDSGEWEGDLAAFVLSTDPAYCAYPIRVIVDSWNNIKKYQNVYGAFFIFDEDHVTGSGAWVKSFLKITNKNRWIILSATPGDKWEDYVPVFVANRFYPNKTAFYNRHAVLNPYVKWRKVERWLEEDLLAAHRRQILVQMHYNNIHIPHHEYIVLDYNKELIQTARDLRWDPFKDAPIENASAYCSVLRKIANLDESRQVALIELLEKHPRLIVFYNFDYELEVLRELCYPPDFAVAEYNGHMHQPVPDGDQWIYLTQYASSAEAWNTIATNAILFYSENYSYKMMVQSAGRIDRLTSPYKDLWYYHFTSDSPIDRAISRSLDDKKDFNEEAWCDEMGVIF